MKFFFCWPTITFTIDLKLFSWQEVLAEFLSFNHTYFCFLTFHLLGDLGVVSLFILNFSAGRRVLWNVYPSITHTQACHLFWCRSGDCCDDDHDHDESDEIRKVPLSLSYNSCRVKYQSLVLAADRYRSDNDVLTVLLIIRKIHDFFLVGQ